MATITGTASSETLNGTSVADQISGLGGDDVLNGGDGNDTLIGGTGADTLVGGAGTDTASYSSSVTINMLTGVHTGEAAGDVFDSTIEIIQGSAVADTFVSGTGANRFDGGVGFDTISYAASTAGVNVNLDSTGAQSGGDATGDLLTSFEVIIGSAYNDTLQASIQNATLNGGLGDDTYQIGATFITVVEAAGGGDDLIRTSLTTFSLAGNTNVERLTYNGATAAFTGTGNALDNVITGAGGNDTLVGGAGADTLIGGAGTDTASYSNSVTINMLTGVHTGEAVGDVFDSTIEIIQGSSLADTFVSGTGANRFDGGVGFDTIDYSASTAGVTVNLDTTSAQSGGDAAGDLLTSFEQVIGTAYNDTLMASAQTRTLIGGLGDDIYQVGATFITVTEAAGAGDDTIRTSLTTFSLAGVANVERLTYNGATAAFTGTGNALDNVITGAGGNDTLVGGVGADTLIGGAGTDTASYSNSVTINMLTGIHTGEAAGDVFDSTIEIIQGSSLADTFVSGTGANRFDGGVGFDTIDYSASTAGVFVNLDSTSAQSGGDATGDLLTSFETVIGTAYNDTLLAASQSRTLIGGLGDDIYQVGATFITVTEAAGAGDDLIRTSLTTFSLAGIANVERLTYNGATAAFTGTGNALDNVITGAGGNDTLVGGVGADTLIGGAGTDTASYSNSVTINMLTGVHTGEAAGDVFDSTIEIIQGSSLADTFVSGTGANRFDGGVGFDTIDYSASTAGVFVNLDSTSAQSGGDATGDLLTSFETVIGSAYNDTLLAASQSRTLIGGLGDDIYQVGATFITVTEAAGAGDDLIRTSLTTFSLAGIANVERLTYNGATAAFTGTGNVLDNVITGAGGNDTLMGGAGADTLIGGAGTDTVTYGSSVTINMLTGVHTGEAAGDVFDSTIEIIQGSGVADTFVSGTGANRFDGGVGFDTISYAASTAGVTVNIDSTSAQSGGDAAGDLLTSFETVIGSDYADTLSAFNQTRTLIGGLGDDIYQVGGTFITVTEAVGGGDDTIRTNLNSFSLVGFANVERLTFNGSGAFTGTGSSVADIITGSTGNDTLIGGGGADTLVGGGGTDTASYADSGAAMTFNFDTGVFSGVGAGDVFDSIEVISGTNFDDTFVAGSSANTINGGSGLDRVTFEASAVGVVLNLSSPASNTGFAVGDAFTSIEVIEGSAFDDSLTGNSVDNIFIGGLGADAFNGVSGYDSVWYLTSTTGVSVDLLSGVTAGDAAGDSFIGIDRLIGSAHADTLTGDNNDNTLEGAGGDDTIDGGAGNDLLYGDHATYIGSFASAGGSGADVIHGGAGDDAIYMNSSQAGSQAYGDNGNDQITINHGEAYGGLGADAIVVGDGKAWGGDGNDTLTGAGSFYELRGEAGDDTFILNTSGDAYGGEGSDTYQVYSPTLVGIEDNGTAGLDKIIINTIATGAEILFVDYGDSLFITSAALMGDMSDGIPDAGVYLENYYLGASGIEQVFAADGFGYVIG